jgi:hypothetical protein
MATLDTIRSFLEGMASIFDFGPSRFALDDSLTPWQKDGLALSRDFAAVAGDFRVALSKTLPSSTPAQE